MPSTGIGEELRTIRQHTLRIGRRGVTPCDPIVCPLAITHAGDTTRQKRSVKGVCPLQSVIHRCFSYRLWDSNPHSFELDFESSASTNSAKPAQSGVAVVIKQGKWGRVKKNWLYDRSAGSVSDLLVEGTRSFVHSLKSQEVNLP